MDLSFTYSFFKKDYFVVMPNKIKRNRLIPNHNKLNNAYWLDAPYIHSSNNQIYLSLENQYL